jgi:TRAP-type transport system periplasmic protein
MKRLFFALSVIALIAMVFMMGCTQSPSPSAAPAPAKTSAAPAPASSSAAPASSAAAPASSVAAKPASGSPIELSFSLEQPPMSWGVKQEWEPWAKQVEAASGGRVKINIFAGASLSPPPEIYDSAVKGVSDIAWGPHSYMPGRFPLLEVFNLPGIALSMKSSQNILWELYQKYPQIEAEHQGVKVLWLGGLSEYVLVMKDKPVRTLEDVANKKIRVTGEAIETWKLWGASPIVISSVEAYQSLDKGVIDGAAFDLNVLEAFKLQEITKYMSLSPSTASSLYLVMNLKRWNSLPPDIQKIFIDAGKEHWIGFADAQDQFKVGVIQRYAALPGHEIIRVSDAERARWIQKAQPLFDKWASDMEAKGLPGKAFLADTLALAKKYNALYPLPTAAK